MCTLFCPHPLLFLFLYFHSSTFQKHLILSFFPLLFFVYFHLMIPEALRLSQFLLSFFSTWFQKLSSSLNYLNQPKNREIKTTHTHDKTRGIERVGELEKTRGKSLCSVFLRLPPLLPLLLLSFCLSTCLWLFGCGFVLFDFCSFGLWFVFWVMIFLCVLWIDFSWVWVDYDFSVL